MLQAPKYLLNQSKLFIFTSKAQKYLLMYVNYIFVISTEMALLIQIIINVKFREDISSNERVSHTSTCKRSFSLYGSYML